MEFEIVNKDAEGKVTFQGVMNKTEAEFVLNVGMAYLLSRGAMPLSDDERMLAPSNDFEQ